ncbi:GvpL/GvpF family gas vesicle protein [Pseudalkalibacillus salsuginis]|uniref:GvpL/GvpF family gas vesicle protein n=1 Tax=Pseudalkalibacillus salsuginis TaxID=2910972 RepID=UPI001F3C95E8|nr:GvpL/GvpF family gas vesicle protein [Pseudalkalibacillus salsuginis]MCF6410788.1 GvpL/GvpF family gas vesicle protein [Pseudalkalibacillus salsuginis]
MDQLIYLYGLIPTPAAAQKSFPSFQGFDGESELYTIPINNVTAVVCRLDPDEYSEETIKEKIDNDMEWLQGKAFHHHETMVKLYKEYPVIPLKFCTIYKNEQSMYDKIQASEEKIEQTFESLEGNEEWNLKIYCDDEKLKHDVSKNNYEIEAKKKEISALTPGRRFFEMKKIDELVEEELEKEKNRVCEKLHEKLKEFSVKAEIKRNWSRDITGLKENMAWNSVFLLPVAKVDSFLDEVKRLEKERGQNGWRFEASGPWPAYHFSSFS